MFSDYTLSITAAISIVFDRCLLSSVEPSSSEKVNRFITCIINVCNIIETSTRFRFFHSVYYLYAIQSKTKRENNCKNSYRKPLNIFLFHISQSVSVATYRIGIIIYTHVRLHSNRVASRIIQSLFVVFFFCLNAPYY